MSLLTYLGISLGLVAFLVPFGLALRENQPQILVSFLILLAIERERAGWNIAGGAALALAASIKLYPALFALL
ncbi:MAG: glycosyltransferase 87 family protein, partial [Alphaproteobacteria bacterium]|nr:glycosyltransferase 87 family protein [Alphaproteobacteria bacterium]